MKRVLTLMTVLFAAAMLNGCTKCSQERPAEPPPVVEPPVAPTDETMPAPEAAPGETAPGTDAGTGAPNQ